MKRKFFEIAQNSIVYGFGNIAQQLIGFLLLPIYTSHLVPTEYGQLALITALSSLLSMLLGMGISTSIFKHFFKEKDLAEKQLIISSALLWLICLGGLTIVGINLLSAQIAYLFLDSTGYATYIRIMALTLAFTQLQVIPFGVLRAEKKPWQYAYLTLSGFLMGIGLNIYFVVVLRIGALGVLLAAFISTFVFVLVGLYLCRHMIRLSFSLPIMKSLLRYGIPLVPSSISLYLLNQADRWFLQHYHTLQDVGIYSLGYRIGSAIHLVIVQPIQMIWLPIVFEMEHQPDAKRFYERMLTYFLVIGCWVGLALISFSKELLEFMAAPLYHGAIEIIPWVAGAYIMYGAYFIVVIGIFLKNRTSYTIWIVGLAGISNLLLNFLLIPVFAGPGAAVATFLSFVVLFMLAWWFNRRVYPLDYEWSRIGKVIGVSFVLLFSAHFVSGNAALTLLVKSILLLSYWGLLGIVGFFDPGERLWIKSTFARIPLTAFRPP